jgi:hypothetical protein
LDVVRREIGAAETCKLIRSLLDRAGGPEPEKAAELLMKLIFGPDFLTADGPPVGPPEEETPCKARDPMQGGWPNGDGWLDA